MNVKRGNPVLESPHNPQSYNYFVASSDAFLKFLSSFSRASETFLALFVQVDNSTDLVRVLLHSQVTDHIVDCV